MKNKKKNLAKALKQLKVEISRSLTKIKALENELIIWKQSQKLSTT
jgi:hypothetical protein